MGIQWFIVSQIRLSESAYSAWLASDVNFNYEITFIDPVEAAPDPIIGTLQSYSKEKSKYSVANFFAKELIWQRENAKSPIFRCKYDREKCLLEFVLGITSVSDKQISKILAVLLSIAEYKNIAGCDICIVSKTDFKNVRYINEIYEKNIMIMPKITTQYYIPDYLLQTYKPAVEMPLTSFDRAPLIDPDIINVCHSIIHKQLEPGIDTVLKNATEKQPAFLTENSLYRTDGKNVIHQDGIILEYADPYSFKSVGGYYSKDKDNVYYGSVRIENADSDTFKTLEWDYAQDRYAAYFQGTLICNLNGRNFRALRPAYGYGTDGRTVYYCGRAMEGSDPNSFHAVGEGRENESLYFGVDKNNVYFEGTLMPHMAAESFQHVGKTFFKDFKYVFSHSVIIEHCAPATVKVLNKYYIADANEGYFIQDGTVTPIESNDIKNLKVSDLIAADKINVYYRGIKIADADGATADIFDKNNDGYITDKFNVFYCDEKISAERETFRTLGFGYAIDDKNVFFRNEKVVDADPQSFIPTSYGSAYDNFSKFSFAKPIGKNLKKDFKNIVGEYFKDDKNIYYKTKTIFEADYESFVPFDNSPLYAKDAYGVYYKGNAVEGADTNSFQPIEHPDSATMDIEKASYAKDIQKIYYEGKEIEGVKSDDFTPHEIPDVWVDSLSLISNGVRVEHIDIKQFTKVEYSFYKDNQKVYYKMEQLEGIMPEGLVAVSPNYIKDEMFFCYTKETPNGTLIKNLFEADENSFDLIEFNSAFSYDKFGLFFRGLRIDDIDINSISYIGDNYLKDANGIFCGNIRLTGVNMETFDILGNGYAGDGINSFYQYIKLDTDKPMHVIGSGYATDGVQFWHYGFEVVNPQDDEFLRETLGVII